MQRNERDTTRRGFLTRGK
ncbi:hypothetical protein A2U01_0112245, partial [Trifolium medium]|nr:hypothetical protein [Trifolium medium]